MVRMTRCYVSHPIAYQSEDRKHLTEQVATTYLTDRGITPILPRQIPAFCISHGGAQKHCRVPGKVIPGDTHSVQCYMRGDIAELLRCDLMLVMPGWQASSGCRDEINVAAMCGISIRFYEGEGI